MGDIVAIQDIEALFRTLTQAEKEKAQALIPTVWATLLGEADKVGEDLTQILEKKPFMKEIAKSVMVDVIARILMTPTNETPMTQMSQSANGYSFSGTYLTPGGGMFIKKSELARLGLKKQRVKQREIFGD